MPAGSRKVVVVTGGSRNIGLAIAERFLAADATVIAADLTPPAQGRLEFVETDVSREASVASLMDRVARHFGGLDVLVNNAGVCVEASLRAMSEAQWDALMAVNVKGVFLTSKHALEPMSMRSGGARAIVNISSIEGRGANPLHAAYGASKGAVAALTRSIALEYGAHGIRCNAVAPGWIHTDFNDALLDRYPDRERVEQKLADLHPVGRVGRPADVAEAVWWLASEQAAFLNGQELVLDGGRLSRLPMPEQ